MGYAKIHIQRPDFDNNKKKMKNSYIENPDGGHNGTCSKFLMPPLHIELFIFEKHKNLNFWWYLKVPQANCFWANFGSFGQNL
jgi:hypothetical protein